jgi:hypothetical protein
MDPNVGKGICDSVPAMAASQKQDAVCYTQFGPQTCAMNGCAPGYESFFLDPSGTSFLCAAYCSPANSYKSAVTALAGNAPDDCSVERTGASGYQCRFIQDWYPDTPTPSGYGVCLDPAAWGDCAEYDPQGIVDVYNTAYANTAGNAAAKSAAASKAFCNYCGLDATCHGTLAPRCLNNGCIDQDTEAAFDAMLLGQ